MTKKIKRLQKDAVGWRESIREGCKCFMIRFVKEVVEEKNDHCFEIRWNEPYSIGEWK